MVFYCGLPVCFCSAGSENNRCFVFEKSFGKPMLEYKFNTSRSLLVRLTRHTHALWWSSHLLVVLLHQQARPGDLSSDTDFVSSVAWKRVSACDPSSPLPLPHPPPLPPSAQDAPVFLAANSQGHIKVSTPLASPSHCSLPCPSPSPSPTDTGDGMISDNMSRLPNLRT